MMRFSGSLGLPDACSTRVEPPESNVEAENGRIGEPLFTGDIGLDVGGVWVDENTAADADDDVAALRNGRLASLWASD